MKCNERRGRIRCIQRGCSMGSNEAAPIEQSTQRAESKYGMASRVVCLGQRPRPSQQRGVLHELLQVGGCRGAGH